MSTEKIVHNEHTPPDVAQDLSYSDYLHLDAVLSAQHPRSPRPQRDAVHQRDCVGWVMGQWD